VQLHAAQFCEAVRPSVSFRALCWLTLLAATCASLSPGLHTALASLPCSLAFHHH
jgi:hypothetical protein